MHLARSAVATQTSRADHNSLLFLQLRNVRASLLVILNWPAYQVPF